MEKVVIVVRCGLVEKVYSQDKEIQVEILDMDFGAADTANETYVKNAERLRQIQSNPTYAELDGDGRVWWK